jgi:FkbM family methyltransferase
MDARNYYAENGEDALLWRLFENEPPGFFIDVGAFDGVYRSASLSFEQAGWSGICVEPHPVFVRQCARNRKKSLCLHAACVADSKLDRTEFFFEPLGVFSHSGGNGTAPAEAGYAARGMKFPGFAKARVPARSLDRIIPEFVPGDTPLDVLLVNVGGNELDVLRGMDFARRAVRALVIRAADSESAKPIASYLEARGYIPARQIETSCFFAKSARDAAVLRMAGVQCRITATAHPVAPHASDGTVRELRLAAPHQICENVTRQEPGQPLWELLGPRIEEFTAAARPTRHYRFAHVVHTYACPQGSRAEATQRLTFGAIERAKCTARDTADVDLISVHLAGDGDFPPAIFRKARELDRTVADVHRFAVTRKLPLVFDILERGVEAAAGADFVIFTNVDICPMPHFYEFVSRLLDLGFDALLINRRVAGMFPLDDRWRALLEADYGGPHPGFDCFVFPVELGRCLIRSNACVGSEYVMRGLLYNLVARSNSMLILTDVHATYHIGADSDAQRPETQDHTRFNQENAKSVLNELARDPDAYRRLRDFCVNHHEFAVPEVPTAESAQPGGGSTR